MSDPINIGVDFGSLGLRVAYVTNGDQPVVLAEEAVGRWPWLLCEQSAQAGLGVSFPSLKSKLGIATTVPLSRKPTKPTDLVAQAFRSVRRAIKNRISADAAQAVISVPARYSASQRAALRESVLQAGFADAHLINDAVAAVMAHTAADAATTMLVYSMGYAGFEIGLVRAVRGHYRALGYEGARSPAGWFFDQTVLQTLLGVVKEKKLVLDTSRWDSSVWMQVRADVQRAKEDLSLSDHVTLPVPIETAEQNVVNVTFSRSDFEQVVGPYFTATLEHTRGLLEQSGLTPADVGVFLLVGGSTQIPILHSLVDQTLGMKTVVTQHEDLARGAALYAARLASHPAPPLAETERAADVEEVEIVASVSAMRAAIVVAEAASERPANEEPLALATEDQRAHPVPDPKAPLEHARHLIEQGQTEQARTLLRGLISEAQGLLERIPAAAAPTSFSWSDFRSKRALKKGRQLLKQGRYEEAVRESHLAWYQSPESPDVLEEMINIHCEAAMAQTAMDGYENACHWLMCAHQHDGANPGIHRFLAERHYLHAKQLNERGKRREALEVIEQCLHWNPEHAGALELQAVVART